MVHVDRVAQLVAHDIVHQAWGEEGELGVQADVPSRGTASPSCPLEPHAKPLVGHRMAGRQSIEFRLEKKTTPFHQPLPEEIPRVTAFPDACKDQAVGFFVLDEAVAGCGSRIVENIPGLPESFQVYDIGPARCHGFIARSTRPYPRQVPANPFLFCLQQGEDSLFSKTRRNHNGKGSFSRYADPGDPSPATFNDFAGNFFVQWHFPSPTRFNISNSISCR